MFIEEIREFAVHDNWDGYGACSVDNIVIENTEKFLSLLNKDFSVEIEPTTNGCISIEIIKENKNLYIEIGMTKYSGILEKNHKPNIFFDGYTIDMKNIYELIELEFNDEIL